MSADTFCKVNWNRVEELLLKEDFRRLIINSGETAYYMIDTIGYTAAPNVIACFKDNSVWKVYETDDRANILKERTFNSARPAYKDAARRRGLILPTSDVIEKGKSGSTVVQMYRRKDAIQTALQNARKLAEILAGEKSGEAATEDAKVLDAALKELKKFSAREVVRSGVSRSIVLPEDVLPDTVYVKKRKNCVFACKVAPAKNTHATKRARKSHKVRAAKRTMWKYPKFCVTTQNGKNRAKI